MCFVASHLVDKLLKFKKNHKELSCLKELIVLDEENYTTKEGIEGIKIRVFSEFEKIGVDNFQEWP